MNLHITHINLQIAKFGGKYLVRCIMSYAPSAGGASTTYAGSSPDLVLDNKEALMAWLANLECKVI